LIDPHSIRPLDRETPIAVIGLGKMGAPIASVLASAGFQVRGWTRNPRSQLNLDPRVKRVRTPEEAVADAGVVILMLTDSQASEALLFEGQVARSIRRDAVVIDMATIGPKAARDHAARLAEMGIQYLDAPVSGGVKGAEAGSLAVFVGGNQGVFQTVRPVLEALGTPHHLGATGAGQTAKLANQIIVAIYIGAVAEGIRFAEAQGMDAALLANVLRGGFADSAILRQHGTRMAARSFEPGGTCRLHLKDLDLANDLLAEGRSRLVLAETIRQRFRDMVADGRGDADHSAYYLTYEDASA